jgi:hypothetical protein
MIQGGCTVYLMCHAVFDNLLTQFLPYSERQWKPERYEIVRKDRTCKKGHEGGGVINAVRKDTVCSGEDTLDTDCEIAWTKIQLKGCKALYTGCFYRKPNNEPSALENLNNSLRERPFNLKVFFSKKIF